MLVQGKSTEFGNIRNLISAESMTVSYAQTGDGQPLNDVVWWNAEGPAFAEFTERPYVVKFEPPKDGKSADVIILETGVDEEKGNYFLFQRPATLEEMTAFALRLQSENDPRAQAAVEFIEEKILNAARDLGVLAVATKEG